jgi:carboxyl-terminal processing protease
LTCKEFFTETVENIPTGVPGISYFKINKFNRETAQDLKKYILEEGPENIDFMVLDIAGNPGGPPLAVVEIASIFLNPGDKLVYYRKKNQPEFGMVTPPSDVNYKGRLVIVVDEKSGSASEILAGSFKAHRRAILMGKSSTAGSANLKTSIRFDDGSMLALLTGQAFIFDGTPMGSSGISPDYFIPEEITDVKPFVLRQIMLSRGTDAS